MAQPPRPSRTLLRHYQDVTTFHNEQALRLLDSDPDASREHARLSQEAADRADEIRRGMARLGEP